MGGGWCGEIVIPHAFYSYLLAIWFDQCNCKTATVTYYRWGGIPKKMSMTIILLQNLLIGLEKQRVHMWKINICPAHGNPWSAQPGPGQVPLRRTDRKCGRSKKLGPLCLPRNARNDSTVFRNSPPRFFDSNYALGLISEMVHDILSQQWTIHWKWP